MGNIPCSLDCEHQNEGRCRLDTASFVSCADGRCPHYLKKQPKKAKNNKRI